MLLVLTLWGARLVRCSGFLIHALRQKTVDRRCPVTYLTSRPLGQRHQTSTAVTFFPGAAKRHHSLHLRQEQILILCIHHLIPPILQLTLDPIQKLVAIMLSKREEGSGIPENTGNWYIVGEVCAPVFDSFWFLSLENLD
mmetsp:Transcript_90798/g.157463  ORF Transcript_90798/g.157463 Transcript_90798/m.157463 type:complete len:140 (-) Transcript_90798:47-466(-)